MTTKKTGRPFQKGMPREFLNFLSEIQKLLRIFVIDKFFFFLCQGERFDKADGCRGRFPRAVAAEEHAFRAEFAYDLCRGRRVECGGYERRIDIGARIFQIS